MTDSQELEHTDGTPETAGAPRSFWSRFGLIIAIAVAMTTLVLYGLKGGTERVIAGEGPGTVQVQTNKADSEPCPYEAGAHEHEAEAEQAAADPCCPHDAPH